MTNRLKGWATAVLAGLQWRRGAPAAVPGRSSSTPGLSPRPGADDSPLTCRHVVELVTEYLEGALAPAEQRRVEAHVATCRHCSTYLDQMRQTIDLLGTLMQEAAPASARIELLRAFRDWKRASTHDGTPRE